MPGSPPKSTRDPGTMPPPSNRSTSGIPSTRRLSSEKSISFRAFGALPVELLRLEELLALVDWLGASTIVFQEPQAGQRPIHFALSAPHSVQNQVLLVDFAILIYFCLARKLEDLHIFQLAVLYLESQCCAHDLPTLQSGSSRVDIQQVVGVISLYFEDVAMSAD